MTHVAARALLAPTETEQTTSRLRPAVRIPRPEEWIADPALVLGLSAPAGERPIAEPPTKSTAPDRRADEFNSLVRTSNRLLVTLRAPEPAHRDQLARYIDQNIEAQLVASGAAARGRDVPTNLSDVLDDQLYRARLLGLDGLGVAFADLSSISERGVLSAPDSQTLRWWISAEQQYPVCVFLSESLRRLSVYQAPICLETLCNPPAPKSPAAPRSRPSRAATRRPPSAQVELPFREGLRSELRVVKAAPVRAASRLNRSSDREQAKAEPEVLANEETLTAKRQAPTSEPTAQSEAKHLRKWRHALSEANSAQTWETLETQFLANYLPLLHARMSDQTDARTDEVLRTWSDNFQQGYQSAYAKLCRYSQRPQMIFDLPKIAFNLARQFECPQVRLILVDGMRFDLGQRVHDKLRLQMTGVGHCVQRGVTWSSLPCDTGAQLELLARGPDGLRSDLGSVDIPELVATGAGARKLRPLRTGPHQLLKLDALQPLLSRGNSWGPEALEEAAAEVAFGVGRFLKQQADNTLTLVFGDHGFDLRDGSSSAATPENVLVPYDVWHTGD